MPTKLAESDQMTVEEFLAFTELRPDGEKWELIDGVPVLSPSPTEWHQRIVLSISGALDAAKLKSDASWVALLGVVTRVPGSPHSLPQPDVFVKEATASDSHVTEDAIVIFEVLSRSNDRKDRAWRKRVYASVPNCQHYVTVATNRAEVICHDRAKGWDEVTLTGLLETLDLAAIGANIPLRDIYRWTPIE